MGWWGRITAGLALAALGFGCAATGDAPVEPSVPEGAPTEQSPAPTGHRNIPITLRGVSDDQRDELIEAVRTVLAEAGEGPLRRAHVDDAAFELSLRLRDRGYAFAEVRYELTLDEEPEVRLEVERGPRVALDVDGIQVSGNYAFSDEEVRAFFDESGGGLLGGETTWYVADRVRSATEDLRRAWTLRGYLDCTVGEPVVEFRDDRGTAHLTLRVEEGFRYRTTEVELSYASECAEQVKECERIARRFSEVYHYPRQGAELRGALHEVFARTGHPDVRLELTRSIDRESRRVRFAVAVDPGREVTISEVVFLGEPETSEHFLRSRLTLEPGDRYDVRKVRSSVRKLYETGLFRIVRIDLAPGAGPERALNVHVEEAPSIEVWFEPGFGSYERLRLRAGVRERNWLGTGLQLSADGKWATRAVELNIGLTDPWFLRTPLIADLTAGFERRELESFTSREVKLGAFLSHEWSRVDRTTFGYRFRRSEALDVTLDLDEIEEDEDLAELLERVDLSSLSLSHRHDGRSNPLFPSSGTRSDLGVEYGDGSLGSDLDFVRAYAQLARFHEFAPGTVVAWNLRGDVVLPRGEDDSIPLQERLFAGGENTVRSYREGQLGPTDTDGGPLGGQARGLATLELRQHLTGQLHGALFADAGHVSRSARDFFDFRDDDVIGTDENGDPKVVIRGSDLGYALGLGLRYHLPIGPVRLDLGLNPDRDVGRDEAAWVLHFSVGMSF